MLSNSVAFDVPHGWKEAVSLASRQPGFARVRRTRGGEVLPGYYTDAKWGHTLVEVLESVRDRLGDEAADNASYVLCVTGVLPRPLGVPHLQDAQRDPPPLAIYAIKLLREMTRRLVLAGKQFSFPHLAMPSSSSCGFPYMATGDDGLLVRRAYVESFIRNRQEIVDLLADRKWNELMSGGSARRFLPLFPISTVSWRLQPEAAVELHWDGAKLASCQWKQREVYDCAYNKRTMEVSVPWSHLNRSMRGRAICAVSSTINILWQAAVSRTRAAELTYPLWHITSVSDSHRRACNLFPNGVTATYDFSQMDHSMTALVWQGYVQGWKDAGASEALCNLANAVHFSPFLTSEDDPAQKPARPVRLVGSPYSPDDPSCDLGTRSGEADTDVVNKVCGTSAHLAAAVYAGLLGGLKPSSTPGEVIDYFFKYVARCIPGPGDRIIFEGNCGDDHAVRAADRASLEKYNKALASFAPFWNVTVEEDCQLLGWSLYQDGRCYPYLGRALSNYLCPERFWTDRMRRDFFMLGIAARDEHYRPNPEWDAAYRPIMIERTISNYGYDPFTVARRYVPATNQDVQNAAELELLYNPDAIYYKYQVGRDVRPTFLDSLGLYYTVQPEQLEQMQV